MKSIKKSEIKGKVIAPSSKSLTIRAILSALLAEGETRIINPSLCNDSLASINAVKQLGGDIIAGDNELIIKGGLRYKNNVINCAESGLLIRLLSVFSPLLSGEIELIAEGTLKKRQLGNIENIFNQFGIDCKTNNGYAPVSINGNYKKQELITIDASSGSQVLSGLLMALPLTEFNSQLNVENLKSKPYIDLTIGLINKFGIEIRNDDYKKFEIIGNQTYKPTIYYVEGDWSGSAFLLVAGAINGEVEITNLDIHSKQGDKILVDILEKVGANISINKNSLLISKSELNSFDFDASDYPDLVPPLTVLALNCEGTSKISGVHRLLHKESNRLYALMKEFNSLGAYIKLENDTMIIKKTKLKGGQTSSHNDHRIAMALAIAGLNCNGPIAIDNCISVNKSYPDFFKHLKSIGGNIDE